MAYGEKMRRLSPCPHGLILSLLEKYRPGLGGLLDIGCGRGERLAAVAEAYPGAYLAGLDSDPDMAALSRKYADVRIGDAESLPFEDESFDAGLCECSLSLFPQPEESLKEAFRVLKKGGVLILGELNTDLGGREYVEAPDGEAVKRIFSPETIEKMAHGAGFVKKEFSDRSGELAAMAAQMIFDGSFCGCVGTESAKLLMKLKAGYGLWVFGKE